jgi:hypothetical protein
MSFEIVVLNLDCHFTFETSFFVGIVKQAFLILDEALIVLSSFELHEVLSNHLLSLNGMEVLLVNNQIPTRFFGVFQLFELDR